MTKECDVGSETVGLRKRQETNMEVAEMKMLMFSLEVKRMVMIRNKSAPWKPIEMQRL